MNTIKHTHGEMLFTDAVDYMQWVETLPDGRLFTIMGVGKPDGARNQTTVSHQLRFLKSAGMVRSCRQGKIVFYSLVVNCYLYVSFGISSLYWLCKMLSYSINNITCCT